MNLLDFNVMGNAGLISDTLLSVNYNITNSFGVCPYYLLCIVSVQHRHSCLSCYPMVMKLNVTAESIPSIHFEHSYICINVNIF